MTSIEALYDALTRAINPNPAIMRAGEENLQAILKEVGVLRKLQTIAVTQSLDLNTRRLAIIQAKNATGTWKMKIKNPEEDLPVIRNQIIQFLEEPDDVIATNNEIMAAKIARLDYPINKWPGLLSGLMEIIQTSAEKRFSTSSPDEVTLLRLRRALSILNSILKEFNTMKSPAGSQTNTKATAELHDFLRDLSSKLSAHTQPLLNVNSMSSPLVAYDLEIARLGWKCYSRIILWAWNKARKPTPEEDRAFIAYFTSACLLVKALVDSRTSVVHAFRTSGSQPDGVTLSSLEVATRHIKALGRAFRRMQQTALPRFVALPDAGPLVLYYWTKVTEAGNSPPEFIADNSHAVYPVRFLVQGMAIFKESLSQWSTSRKASAMETDNEILSPDFVAGAVRLLVNCFIPLKSSDLEKWQEDPEEWATAEEKDNDAWEFDVRPCSERVIMTVANQYPETTSDTLLGLFQAVVANPTGELDAILQREAVYCAIGRCAGRMKGRISFDQWLPLLESEATATGPNYRIIKRRIAWVIGKWIMEECSPSSNPKVWEILLHLLTDTSAGTDTVVRYSAATALSQCVNTLDFKITVIQPYLGGFVEALLRLVHEVDTVETKSRMIHALNVLIECTQKGIAPFIPSIVQPLPSLWTEAGTDYVIKQALLISVKVVAEASKENSAALLPLIVPLVQESFLPVVRLQLDEDGMLLWQAALHNCVMLQSQLGQPSLLDLFPLAINLLSNDLDMLGSITLILESYFVLDVNSILNLCAPQLFQAYSNTIRVAMSPNVKDILSSIGLLVQLSDSSLSWANAIHSSGLFAYMVKHLTDGKGSSTVLTEELYAFARMALQDPVVFVQLVAETASTHNSTPEEVLEKVLDQWWRQFDSMAEPRHRKLTAMALANLATTGRPEVLKRLSTEISNVWIDVLGEMKEALTEDSDNPSHLNAYWVDNGGEPPREILRDTEGTLEETRRRELWGRDPVQTVKLTTYLSEKLKQTEAVVGSAVFQEEFIAKTDPGVLKQLTAAFAS